LFATQESAVQAFASSQSKSTLQQLATLAKLQRPDAVAQN
jgi:hypothetical protein